VAYTTADPSMIPWSFSDKSGPEACKHPGTDLWPSIASLLQSPRILSLGAEVGAGRLPL